MCTPVQLEFVVVFVVVEIKIADILLLFPRLRTKHTNMVFNQMFYDCKTTIYNGVVDREQNHS